jgi:hypothetical protein
MIRISFDNKYAQIFPAVVMCIQLSSEGVTSFYPMPGSRTVRRGMVVPGEHIIVLENQPNDYEFLGIVEVVPQKDVPEPVLDFMDKFFEPSENLNLKPRLHMEVLRFEGPPIPSEDGHIAFWVSVRQ